MSGQGRARSAKRGREAGIEIRGQGKGDAKAHIGVGSADRVAGSPGIEKKMVGIQALFVQRATVWAY